MRLCVCLLVGWIYPSVDKVGKEGKKKKKKKKK